MEEQVETKTERYCKACYKTVKIKNWEKHILTKTHKDRSEGNRDRTGEKKKIKKQPLEDELLEKLRNISGVTVNQEFHGKYSNTPTTIQLRIEKEANSVHEYSTKINLKKS